MTNLEVEQALENEEGDNVKIIDMHMYMTAAQKKTDMKGIGLQIALDMMHEKSDKDLITGLKTKTQPGRPDWNKVSVVLYVVSICMYCNITYTSNL